MTDTEQSRTPGGISVIDREGARTKGGDNHIGITILGASGEWLGSGVGQLGVEMGEIGMNYWGTKNIQKYNKTLHHHFATQPALRSSWLS